MAKLKNMWECPTCGDYVDNSYQSCPNCKRLEQQKMPQPRVFAPSSINKTESKSEDKWILEPAKSSYNSWAATFLKVIAVILFVGGLAVSIMNARIEIEGYYSSYTKFSWLVFVETYLIYGVSGGLTLCASELVESVKRIADSLNRMEIRKK